MDTDTVVKSFPTIRAQVGDWAYYVTTLPFYEAARRIRPVTELPVSELSHSRSLDTWIQREVMPRRRGEIADYLIHQTERFFNAIVVGVYGGEPKWYGIEVAENNLFGAPGLDERFHNALGIMELSGEEQLYAIDGQHRIAGIEEALHKLSGLEDVAEYRRLANEDLTMVFVAADMDAGHLQRVRRMFSTLNKRAKAVNKSELIALDEDDPGPIITRRLVSQYRPFAIVAFGMRRNQEFALVHLGKSTQIPKGNRHSLTTIVTLLDMIESIFKEEIQSLKIKHHESRPTEGELDELYDRNIEVWESLRQSIPEIDSVLSSAETYGLSGGYRHDEGGHMLFRPIGQQAFADALGELRKRGFAIDKAVEHLAKAPMRLSEPPWRHVLWDPSTSLMVNAHRATAANLFLYMVGQPPKPGRIDFRKRFQDLYAEETTTLDLLPVSAIQQ